MAPGSEVNEIHISANQWRTAILKACVGAYVTRGVAEDVADGCLALLANGVNPLDQLLPLITQFSPGEKPISPKKNGDVWTLSQAQVLRCGPSLVDLAQCGITVNGSVDNLLLLFGLCEARRFTHGSVFETSRDGLNWSQIDLSHVTLEKSDETQVIWLRIASTTTPKTPKFTRLPYPDQAQWAQLQKLTAEILVPADETNRADAGAGLTDND